METSVRLKLGYLPTILRSNLVAAILSGEDVHRFVAGILFSKNPADITTEERRRAKVAIFASSYGLTEYGFASQFNTTKEVARDFFNVIFTRFPGLKTYQETTIQLAREQGYLESLLKRRRYFPEINNSDFSIRAHEERESINFPIQAGAADIVKLAMSKIDYKSYGPGTKFLSQVHDELIYECFPEVALGFSMYMESEMINAYPLDVPLAVNIKIGRSWEEIH